MSPEQANFYHLGVAPLIGPLIGIERGWAEREEEEGGRVAGVRTFSLIAILGGAAALLNAPLREPLTSYALLALGALLAVARSSTSGADPRWLALLPRSLRY
jgi:hypothetical protein